MSLSDEAYAKWKKRLLGADDSLKFIQGRLTELASSPNRNDVLACFADTMREVAEGDNATEQKQFLKVASQLKASGQSDSEKISQAYYVGGWNKYFRQDPDGALKELKAQEDSGQLNDPRLALSIIESFSQIVQHEGIGTNVKDELGTIIKKLRPMVEELNAEEALPFDLDRSIAEIANGSQKEKARLTLAQMIKEGQSESIFNAVLNSSLTQKEQLVVLQEAVKIGAHEKGTNPFYDTLVSCMSEMRAKTPIKGPFKYLIREVTAESKPTTTVEELIHKGNQLNYNLSGQADGLEQALAVQNYAALEKDPQKREQFATKQLNKYVESLGVTNLNDKEKEKISKAFIAIMEPICGPKEKIGLKNSVDKLVRECAQHAGEKMSFSQAWRANIVEPIKRLLGRENVLKSFEKGSTAIKDSINKKTTSFTAQENAKKAMASENSKVR